ncbi:MAG TPA: hypothetical protein VF712_13905 [Thermoleophilaceae bacterium]|jgi:hypothetical protein
MTLLRPHLRTCLICRARLRDYRAVPARVAALAPPVAAGSLLGSAHAALIGACAWLRESLGGASGWISERGGVLAARWHEAAEIAVAHKGVAVVASAAVLGGGGVATLATVGAPEPARRTATVSEPMGTRPQPPPATSRLTAPAADDRDRPTPRRNRPTPAARAVPHLDFAPEARA